MRWKSTVGAAIADLAVFVEVEDADVGQLGRVQPFVEVAGDPFQVGPPLAEAVDAGRVEIDADKAAGRQDAFAFQQIEGEQAGRAHQLAPVAAQPGAVAVFPEQVGGFAQDAEVAFAAGGFRGVVEGVVLAVGKSGHDRLRSQGVPTQIAMALAMSSSWPGVSSPSLSRKRVSETDFT